MSTENLSRWQEWLFQFILSKIAKGEEPTESQISEALYRTRNITMKELEELL